MSEKTRPDEPVDVQELIKAVRATSSSIANLRERIAKLREQVIEIRESIAKPTE